MAPVFDFRCVDVARPHCRRAPSAAITISSSQEHHRIRRCQPRRRPNGHLERPCFRDIHRNVRDAARLALTRLLPCLNSADAGLLKESHRALLRSALARGDLINGTRGRDRDFEVAIIQAFGKIGDWRSATVIESLTSANNKAIREAARQCLSRLQQLAAKQQVGETLLRASSHPVEALRTLCRGRRTASVLRNSQGSCCERAKTTRMGRQNVNERSGNGILAKQGVKRLLKRLGNRDERASAEAEQRLHGMGRKGADLLMAFLEDVNRERQGRHWWLRSEWPPYWAPAFFLWQFITGPPAGTSHW